MSYAYLGLTEVAPHQAVTYTASIQANAAQTATNVRRTGFHISSRGGGTVDPVALLSYGYQSRKTVLATASSASTVIRGVQHLSRALSGATGLVLRSFGRALQASGSASTSSIRSISLHLSAGGGIDPFSPDYSPSFGSGTSGITPASALILRTARFAVGASSAAAALINAIGHLAGAGATARAASSGISSRAIQASAAMSAQAAHSVGKLVAWQASVVAALGSGTTRIYSIVLTALGHQASGLVRRLGRSVPVTQIPIGSASRSAFVGRLAAASGSASVVMPHALTAMFRATAATATLGRFATTRSLAASASALSGLRNISRPIVAASAHAVGRIASVVRALRLALAGGSTSVGTGSVFSLAALSTAVARASLGLKSGKTVITSGFAAAGFTRALPSSVTVAQSTVTAYLSPSGRRTFQASTAGIVSRISRVATSVLTPSVPSASAFIGRFRTFAALSGLSASIQRLTARTLAGSSAPRASVRSAILALLGADATAALSETWRIPSRFVESAQVSIAPIATGALSVGKRLAASASAMTDLGRHIGNMVLRAITAPAGDVNPIAIIVALLRQRVLLPIAIRSTVIPPENPMSDQVADPPAFSAIDPADGDILTFDWSRRAAAGDTIVGASVLSEPAGLTLGPAQIAGLLVQVNVSGVTVSPATQPIYGVRCSVTFASTRKSSWTIPLPVRSL